MERFPLEYVLSYMRLRASPDFSFSRVLNIIEVKMGALIVPHIQLIVTVFILGWFHFNLSNYTHHEIKNLLWLISINLFIPVSLFFLDAL